MTTASRSDPDDLVDLSALATERRNSRTEDIDLLPTEALLALINDEDAGVPAAVAREIPAIARAVDAIVERFRQGGRLVYIGAGTSGRLGVLDASECPPTFNTPLSMVVGLIAGGDRALRNSIEAVEDNAGDGADALRSIDLQRIDVVVGIAASGRTPFVLGALAYAREIGATTIGLSNSSGSRVAQLSDIAITPLVGAEVVTGSTRLKAGTSQKLVLNMLTTGAMIRMGKTFGNLMVDVQPTNAKLRTRAIGIVRDATGIDDEAADRLLAESDGEVKTAILRGLLGISPAEARGRLTASHGVVRTALEQPGQ